MCRVYGTTAADTLWGQGVGARQRDAFAGEPTPSTSKAPTTTSPPSTAILGDCANPTVAPSVRSNLTTILGRTAAYKRKEVTWDEMMKANEKWEFKTKGLSA